jgi:PAS domain S-box-containing protein
MSSVSATACTDSSAISTSKKLLVGNLVLWLKRRSETTIIAIGVTLLALIGLADYLASPRVVVSLFYLIPIMLVAGGVGRAAGIIMATASTVVWMIAELLVPARYSALFLPSINVLIRFGVFVATALVASALRSFHDELQTRIEQRMADLRKEVAVRKLAEEQLRSSELRFRQVMETINEVFWMTNVEKTEMIYISPGYEKIWGRTCRSLTESPLTWLDAIHPEDRERVLRASLTKQAGGDYDEQYRILRPDGTVRWIRDRAFPIRDETGRVYRLAGIAEDITEHKQLERGILEVSEHEKQRLGQDLHDGLCQDLVALAVASKLLEQKLRDGLPVASSEAERIVIGINNAIVTARGLAQGLYPVQLERDGLTAALHELCDDVERKFALPCQFVCERPVEDLDMAQARELYRIAQEALNNAVKHGQPSRIGLRLCGGDGRIDLCVANDGDLGEPRCGNCTVHGQVTLCVADDGVGVQPVAPHNGGMGLAIMSHRARSLGGNLTIRPRPLRGTCVTCWLPVPVSNGNTNEDDP